MNSKDLAPHVGKRLLLSRGAETLEGKLIGENTEMVGANDPLSVEHPWTLEEVDGSRTSFFPSDQSIRITVL
jgi:hypothetical protein